LRENRESIYPYSENGQANESQGQDRRTEMMRENFQLGSSLMANHLQTADTVEVLQIWEIFRGISQGEISRFSEGFREVGFRDFQRDSPDLGDFQRDFGGGTRRSKLETRLLHRLDRLKAEADWIP
ncbi:hypothetical protein U1Q18_044361, partial [Sarracenia purpurea var. burkii]